MVGYVTFSYESCSTLHCPESSCTGKPATAPGASTWHLPIASAQACPGQHLHVLITFRSNTFGNAHSPDNMCFANPNSREQ